MNSNFEKGKKYRLSQRAIDEMIARWLAAGGILAKDESYHRENLPKIKFFYSGFNDSKYEFVEEFLNGGMTCSEEESYSFELYEN